MSVLFKALRKAADENRSSEAEVAVPVIGAPAQARTRRVSPVLVLVVLVAAAGAGFFVAFPDLVDELAASIAGDQQPMRPPLVAAASPPAAPTPAEPAPAPDPAPEPAVAEAPPVEPTAVLASPAPGEPQSLLPPAPHAAAPPDRVVGAVEPPAPRRDMVESTAGVRAPVVLNRSPPAEELADRRAAADPDGRLQVAPRAAPRPSPAPAASPPPASIGRLQENAYRALSEGNLEGALRQYQQVLQRERDNKSALLGKAVVLQRLGLKNSAQEAYEELLAVDPGNRTAMANLLAVLAETQPQAALAQLQRLEQSNPTSAPIVAQLGLLYAQQGDLAAAAQRLQLAAALAPENPVYKLNLAILYDRAGRAADAVAMYDQALRQATASSEPLPMALDDVRRRLTYLAGRN